jgi:hypothetical protein
MAFFQHRVGRFNEQVAELLRQLEAGAPVELPPAEADVFAALGERAKGAGLEVAFMINCDVVNPTRNRVDRGPRMRELARRGVVDTVVDLGRPDRYPDLFRPEHRFDWMHLDEAGADVYTRRLADLWLRDRERLTGERGGEDPPGSR